jgi:hypothetical protein
VLIHEGTRFGLAWRQVIRGDVGKLLTFELNLFGVQTAGTDAFEVEAIRIQQWIVANRPVPPVVMPRNANVQVKCH